MKRGSSCGGNHSFLRPSPPLPAVCSPFCHRFRQAGWLAIDGGWGGDGAGHADGGCRIPVNSRREGVSRMLPCRACRAGVPFAWERGKGDSIQRGLHIILRARRRPCVCSKGRRQLQHLSCRAVGRLLLVFRYGERTLVARHLIAGHVLIALETVAFDVSFWCDNAHPYI